MRETVGPTESFLYRDDPVSAEGDLLDRRRIARQMSLGIARLAERTESASVAIVGPWGSGKTSLLGQIVAELESAGWHVGYHNPWAYSDYASAVIGFFSSLQAAVPDSQIKSELRATLGKWVGRLAPIGAIGGLVGVDASTSIGAIGQWISGDDDAESLRQKAAEELDSLDRPVLMVIDDLDRLSSDELLMTFKLVRLLGRLPKVFYLLAYDEQTVVDSLTQTDLVADDAARAQAYLEKIVQLRFEVPPLTEEQRAAFTEAALNEVREGHGIVLAVDASNRLSTAWQLCLREYLDQPRSIKNLFTHVDAHWSDVADEVDFVDFILFSFLRLFETKVADLLVAQRDDLFHRATYSTHDLLLETAEDRWRRWKTQIGAAEPRHPGAIERLVAEMLLSLRGARDNTTYAGGYVDDIRRRLGVGAEEFFDRYVQGGVAASDLSLGLVRLAASELRAGALAGGSLDELAARVALNPAQAVERLGLVDADEPIPPRQLLAYLGPMYLKASDFPTGLFEPRGDYAMRRLVIKSLDRVSPADAAVALSEAASNCDESTVALVADVVRRARAEGVDESAWAALVRDEVAQRVEALLRSWGGTPVAQLPHLIRFLYAFVGLADRVRTQALVWGLVDHGAWRVEELLGLLVPTAFVSEGHRSWRELGDPSAGDLEELFGLDRLLEQVPLSEGLAQTASLPASERASEATLAERTQRALEALERIRAQRVVTSDESE